MVLLLGVSSEHSAHIEVNQVFRFVEGIWFGYIKKVVKSDFFTEKPILLDMCATCSKLPSYISTMGGKTE